MQQTRLHPPPSAQTVASGGAAAVTSGPTNTRPATVTPDGLAVLGLGTDVVDLATFQDQLQAQGTRFAQVFSDREHALAAARPAPQASLAARWAGKEAFVKAWSLALLGSPPPVGDQPELWAQIEVLADQWGRPYMYLAPNLAAQVAESLGMPGVSLETLVTLSHDGPVATATVIIGYKLNGEN